MRKLFVLMAVMLAVSTPALAGLVNGDWGTGDETGWTRWAAPWGASNYAVTVGGPTPPEGTASLNQGQAGSFGWFQTIAVPVGLKATVFADWEGLIGGTGWAEVMFWTQAVPGGEGNRADVGAAADIAFKKDSWGMNPPTTWGWQPANASPHPGGNFGTVFSQGFVVVALKLGSSPGPGAPTHTSWDNIRVDYVPEPGSLLALATGLIGFVGLRRMRRR